MGNKPFFSVVTPTRSRAQHLRTAIASVLGQTFGDFELIVSDNCSQDETAEVVRTFDDERVKYFRSDKPLTIGDSYEFALSHATGEYISFLSDDDAYVPSTLERLKRVIDEHAPEIVTFRSAVYYRDGDFEFERKIAAGTMAVTAFTGNLTGFDSRQAAKLLFQSFGLDDTRPSDDFIISYLSNAVFHHAVFPRIRAVRSEIFAATPADLYLAAAVIFATDKYYCLDEPLYVWHNWAENTTASPHKKGSEIRLHYEKLLAGRPLEFTPLKFALHQNCCINAILQARDDFDKPGGQAGAEVNWAEYYVFIYDNLLALKNTNVDVSREIEEFVAVLGQESPEIRNEVNARIRNIRFVLKQSLRKFPPAVRVAKRLLGQKRADNKTFVGGPKKGFTNVLEAARFLQTLSLDDRA